MPAGRECNPAGYKAHTHTHTHTFAGALALTTEQGRVQAVTGGTMWSRRDLPRSQGSKWSKLKVMDGMSWTGIPEGLGIFAETRKTIKIFGDIRTKWKSDPSMMMWLSSLAFRRQDAQSLADQGRTLGWGLMAERLDSESSLLPNQVQLRGSFAVLLSVISPPNPELSISWRIFSKCPQFLPHFSTDTASPFCTSHSVMPWGHQEV